MSQYIAMDYLYRDSNTQDSFTSFDRIILAEEHQPQILHLLRNEPIVLDIVQTYANHLRLEAELEELQNTLHTACRNHGKIGTTLCVLLDTLAAREWLEPILNPGKFTPMYIAETPEPGVPAPFPILRPRTPEPVSPSSSSDEIVYPPRTNAPSPPPSRHTVKRKKAVIFTAPLSHQGSGTAADPFTFPDTPIRVDTPDPHAGKTCWLCGKKGHFKRNCPERMCKTCWNVHSEHFPSTCIENGEAGWDNSWDGDVEWDDTAYGNVTGERMDD
ncbi:hypothetical protein BJ138DRAFT_189122 [Hygrophoropsis aurantiaca]|uniref:Uncharacterized protein n=1 Tax=Hygrophoropsis aurantiaca TaxID=72124 RepID=A0ACB7ZPU9_9AGAM|nr:hypothetical protein BJ138DRAFT_189122 [Hygrophoropsis aurantiaca]